MSARKGVTVDALIEAWRRNHFGVRATARELGVQHSVIIRRLRLLYDAGDERVTAEELFKNRKPVSRTYQEINRARLELGMRSEAKFDKGDWRKANVINRITSPVFILGMFGDPHLDNPGCDLDLFEEELERLDPSQNVYGICIGDVFDNWVRALAHAGQQSTDPYAAWIVYEDMMARHPFLALILGNHDLWNTGTASALVEACRGWGVICRRSGGRFIFNTGAGEPISVAARHIWQGNSIYSEAHPLKRAAMTGITDDDVLVGGHFHKGEVREHVRPHDGRVSKLVMLDTFKVYDDYANDRGFLSAKRHPVVWLVCDTREPKTSQRRVLTFYDFDDAQAMYRSKKAKNA